MSEKSPKETIKAIVFDAYGTLFDLNSLALECDKLYPGKGRHLLEVVRQKQLEYTWILTLMGTFKDFSTITNDAIKFALRNALNSNDAREASERLSSVFLELKPFNDVEEALSDLDEIGNLRVAVLSNGSQAMLDKLVENAGLSLLAEEIVSVEGSKRYKPDPKAYEHILNHLEIYERRKVFYVSGNTWDVAGAKSFGFSVGWINRNKAPSFDEDLLEFRPDFEFSNLGQISKLLLIPDGKNPQI